MANNVEFDYVLQREGLDYLKNLIESVKVYMLAGIKLSHQGKVKPEDFWQNLFIKEGTGWNGKEGKPGDDKPIMMPSWDKKAEKIPADPYLALDFQATNKYLYYGGDRILSWNGTRANFAQDNYLFFEYFNINPVVKRNGFGPKKPKNGYERVLKDCISMRNFGAHEDLETLDEINPEALSKKIALLKSLTEDLERKKGWESKCPILTDRGFPTVKQFWEEQDRTYNQKFGAPPLDLEEMKCLLFETTEFTEAQNAAMDSALEEYQVTVKNGKIYHQPSQKELTRKLRRSTAICELMGPPQEIIQKLPVPKPVVAVTRPPVKKTAAGILQRAGFFLNGNREVMNALADGFTVLVDETIFLAAEGRVLLEKQLMPTLRERKAKLFVDESVIATLFRQFRRSVPYTELELAEIEPELREELQDIRRETHKNCKAAIKAVSTLRQQRCLEVVESLTESEHSYDNIFQVAQDNPQSRFFVLSLDGQLAEELQSVTGQNAVAAKPTLDQRLLVYKSSRKTYQALLDESAPQAAPRQVIPSEPQVNLAGSRVVAEWPDGSRQELRLGKSMGEGGEGAIYNTSAPGNAVAKIYHRRQQTQARREKLTHMIQSNPNIFGLCWPQALVYSTKGEWLGFLMPRAEGRELALTVYHPGRNNSTLMKLGWTRKSLALIAANIAAAFAKMHEKGILMGDVNPRNFMVAEDCSVFLVDCDSYQFDGFPCPVGTPCTPPRKSTGR